jgi:stearoyl-CoA desaturase (delta-9 desaturase)
MVNTSKKFAILISIRRWFDADAAADQITDAAIKKVDWFRIIPFVIMHTMCLGVIWVGWSWFAVLTAAGLYFIRMFAITGFYHRYFSHKAFKTNRFWQFIFAAIGNSSVQRGPLWWAAHHRHHHRYADTEKDIHSPSQHGFIWSHIGWLTSPANFPTKMQFVKDWAKYPELRWINRYDIVIPILLATALFLGGYLLQIYAPQLATSGPQLLIWGFFISSVVLFHATVTINSFDHMIGSRRYDTPDTSRNNVVLALITLGEGWHNRQGFYWWEIDMTYYLLKVLSWLGIVWDLRGMPEGLRDQNRVLTDTPLSH